MIMIMYNNAYVYSLSLVVSSRSHQAYPILLYIMIANKRMVSLSLVFLPISDKRMMVVNIPLCITPIVGFGIPLPSLLSNRWKTKRFSTLHPCWDLLDDGYIIYINRYLHTIWYNYILRLGGCWEVYSMYIDIYIGSVSLWFVSTRWRISTADKPISPISIHRNGEVQSYQREDIPHLHFHLHNHTPRSHPLLSSRSTIPNAYSRKSIQIPSNYNRETKYSYRR